MAQPPDHDTFANDQPRQHGCQAPQGWVHAFLEEFLEYSPADTPAESNAAANWQTQTLRSWFDGFSNEVIQEAAASSHTTPVTSDPASSQGQPKAAPVLLPRDPIAASIALLQVMCTIQS